MASESKPEVWPDLTIAAKGPRKVRIKIGILLALYLVPLIGLAALLAGASFGIDSIDKARYLSEHGIVAMASLESERVESTPPRSVYTYSYPYERGTRRFDDLRSFSVRQPAGKTGSKTPKIEPKASSTLVVTIVPDQPEKHRWGVYAKADVVWLELEIWLAIICGAAVLVGGTAYQVRVIRKEYLALRDFEACPAKIGRLTSLLRSGKTATADVTYRYLKPGGGIGEVTEKASVPGYQSVIGQPEVVLEDFSRYGTARVLSNLSFVAIAKE